MRKITTALLALTLLGVGASTHASSSAATGRKILILGTSTTEGMGATPLANRYASLVAQARPTDEFTVLGRGGTTLADAATANWLDYAVPGGHDVVVLQFGFNEWNRGTPVATFKTWAGDFVTRVRASNPGAKVVWLSPWISQYVPTSLPDGRAELWQQYGMAVGSVLRAAGGSTAHVDLDPTGSRRLAAPFSFGAADGLHYNNAGHAKIAEALLTVI
jgi:lysophospholipase L1-like esterase